MKFDYLFLGYPSGITDNTTIAQAADLLQTDLTNVIVDRAYKSIALVSHSMGGLVARQFILNNAIQNNKEILDRITLVINIATPHLGTNVAKLASLVLKHINVNNMEAFSEYLQKTSENWKDLIEHESVWTGLFVVVAGTEDDVVPYASVRQQYNQAESLPYGHGEITRVDDANHGFYRLLLRYLLQMKHVDTVSSDILRVAYLSCTGPYNTNEKAIAGEFINLSGKPHMLSNVVWKNYKYIKNQNFRNFRMRRG